jgi:DUF4097 and DUF4098 domain-containing protein YvlB
MASATQVPPAPPARPPRPPRSFAGPIVLIVIGIFFLLGNLRVLNWYDLGRWFAHYWPVLLILWGIIKVIEYQQANRAGVRGGGIGAGGVLLIIFLVVCGFMATEAYRVNWQELRDQFHMEGADIPWWGHTYDYDDQLEQPFVAGSNLRVTSERGAINLSASSDNQIHVTVHKRISADRQEDADKWNQLTRPKIRTSGETVVLDANTQGAGDHWVSSDLDISLPRRASVAISTRHGDVSVVGRDGTAEITGQHGEVAVTDLHGSVNLNLDHSSARLSQIASDVTIEGRADDVSLEDIKGSVRLDGDFMETVKLSRLHKPLSFKSSRTEMDFPQLGGYLNLDSGDLEASTISGPLRLRTRSKDIMLNGVTGDVHLENQNGAIEIHVNRLGSLDIKNEKGEIRLFLPEKSGFQLDAAARDGEIQSDFGGLKIENSEDRSTANGAVNGGGPHLVVSNEHGSIEIRKGMAAPPVPPLPSSPPETPSIPEPTEN